MTKTPVRKIYIVSLTERFEVIVEANSRSEAIEEVTYFGDQSPVYTRITARLARKEKLCQERE